MNDSCKRKNEQVTFQTFIIFYFEKTKNPLGGASFWKRITSGRVDLSEERGEWQKKTEAQPHLSVVVCITKSHKEWKTMPPFSWILPKPLAITFWVRSRHTFWEAPDSIGPSLHGGCFTTLVPLFRQSFKTLFRMPRARSSTFTSRRHSWIIFIWHSIEARKENYASGLNNANNKKCPITINEMTGHDNT